jgi:cytochrome P450
LLTADAPVHTRNRKLVNLAFSAPRVNAIESTMREKSIALIEEMAKKAGGDFVEDFAIPLPVFMIAGQIGLKNDPKQVKDWSDAAVDRFSQLIDFERKKECARSLVEYQHYMKGMIDDRRENGGDDLLTDLVNARVEGEEPLTDPQVMSIMQQFMVAGNETTTSTLAGCLLQLIRNPDQMEKAKAAAGGRDPKLLGNMVEESLRYETPSAGMWRIVKEDTELGGVELPTGSVVQLRYAAANRDPRKFENPDKFDIERKNARAHLAFGKGPHMCVGNMLSRKEILVAFDELLERLDNFAVADEDAITVLPNILLRGVTKLPVTYTAAS